MSKIAAFFVVLLAVLIGFLLNSHLIFRAHVPMSDQQPDFFGRGKKSGDDVEIYPFKIHVPDDTIDDLKHRLNTTIFFDSLPNSKFNYGTNDEYLQKLHEHWLNHYNWRKYEKELNTKFQNYKTQIEGLNVHFVHVKPPSDKRYIHVIPLLLVHGWPGNVYEFLKIMPMLTDPKSANIETNGVAFEVVAPSIPGYAWSEAPHKQGFGSIASARVFAKLMEKLKFRKFVCQGGDWGAIITTHLAQMYPQRVLGLHVNSAYVSPMYFPGIWLQMVIGYFAPSLIFWNPIADHRKLFPFSEKFKFLLQESGYAHIQATKPDTVGFALLNSPMGLASYIIEKYSTWTHSSYRDMDDGGLNRQFSMDELITHTMIFWTTKSVMTSQRFYKEHFIQPNIAVYDKALVTVPTGVAMFPNDVLVSPKNFLTYKFRNLTLFTDMPRGGHFAAFEQPKLLAEHVFLFVKNLL